MLEADGRDSMVFRALLRNLRGARRQTDAAAAAGVSLSQYRRLESGRHCTMRLPSLIRVADALGARGSQRAQLIRLGRPDLFRTLTAVGAGAPCDAEGPLYGLATAMLLRLGQRRELITVAVEMLHVALGPGYATFAFERRTRQFSMSTYIQGDASARLASGTFAFRAPSQGAGLRVLDDGETRRIDVPVRDGRRLVAVLGTVYFRNRGSSRNVKTVLKSVAEILELTLRRSPKKNYLSGKSA